MCKTYCIFALVKQLKQIIMKTTKIYDSVLRQLQSGIATNQGVQNYMFKVLNGTNEELKQPIKDVFQDHNFEGISLGDEQNQKAFDWLKNLWVTPTGKERKNNPFGYREQDALNNFSHCTLKGYYDAGNYYRSYYIPLYEVYTKDGYGFEYYVNGGQIHITG